MVVLSLFDGMSCGQIALKEIGADVGLYFASEIDKAAMRMTARNFPGTVQLGDVRDIVGAMVGRVDLLIGGSPCQSFSFAGKRGGSATVDGVEVTDLETYLGMKGDFEFEGQSYLFWEYVRILKETTPKYFLLENVFMSKKWEDVISKALGVEPVRIKSEDFGPVNRKRMYWTNIPLNVEEIKPSGKDTIADIMHHGLIDVTERFDKKVPGTLSYKKARSNSREVSQKMKCLTTDGPRISNSGSTNILHGGRVHIPSPEMCEAAHSVPIGYTDGESRNKRYHAIGNGWDVHVVKHILAGVL